MKITEVEDGITAVSGFSAGGIACGIKKNNQKDLAIIACDCPCQAAAVFARNKIKASSTEVNQKHLKDGMARAIVVNSGCANVCTGEKGIADAEKMTVTCAGALDLEATEVLVASTGHIGTYLPIDKVEAGIRKLAPNISSEGGDDAAEAIMTTDTYSKKVAVEFKSAGRKVRIGAIAKGAGMIQPNMATMHCFIGTDAAVEGDFLKKSLKAAVDRSFNKITVDGDQSTSDTVILLANGKAENASITFGNGEQEFQEALDYVCLRLAKMIVMDGEGATKFVEIKVSGADLKQNALTAARAMANSNLFKCAVYAGDPNWGRLMASLGSCGVDIDPKKVDIYFGDLLLVENGQQVEHNRVKLEQIMGEREIYITVALNAGSEKDRIWTCDLTHKYIDINME